MTATLGLDPAQCRAVETTIGPLLIIAGPGSGKTHTLVSRTVRLIVEENVPPAQILVSTFTEKAAAELITRITNKVASLGVELNLAEMYVGTLHSICLRFLDENRDHTRLKRNYAIWDQFEQQYAIYTAFKHLTDLPEASDLLGPPNLGSRWLKSQTLARRFNQVTEELLDLESLVASSDPQVRALGLLYQRYDAMLVEKNALDFSLIQLEALRLLRGHVAVRDTIRSKIRYLMVDEYQDTNTVQEALLFELAGTVTNLCVVGDDDQVSTVVRTRADPASPALGIVESGEQGFADVEAGASSGWDAGAPTPAPREAASSGLEATLFEHSPGGAAHPAERAGRRV